jgi:hypothetical protein
MFGSNSLEVAIGVTFIYLLLSLVCTTINEGIASIINQRGKTLFEGVKNLLNDPNFTGLAQQLYTHGLVAGISPRTTNPNKAKRLPSYMSSQTFALALLDLLASKGVGVGESEGHWQDVVAQSQADLDTAKVKFDANPNETELQKIFDNAQVVLKQAQTLLQKAADAKQAHEEANEAAQKVKGAADVRQLQEASAKLEKALALGRALAAEFPDPLANIRTAVQSLPE